MKTSGAGQAKVLSSDEMNLLFTDGLVTPRDRALFAVCYFTACRVSEALQLRQEDVGDYITFRRAIVKGKLKSRTMKVKESLSQFLTDYVSGSRWLFPGKDSQHLSRQAADKILREACERIGLKGVSSHSFRRTALTQMSDAGIPLRTIQEISGHRSLATLQRYLEVKPQAIDAATAVLGW